jgi:flagellar biogenesis protein FliO
MSNPYVNDSATSSPSVHNTEGGSGGATVAIVFGAITAVFILLLLLSWYVESLIYSQDLYKSA